tara:strand:- start:297 stop:467 length:171 start_codon:yes stop_codon:yes gene_type:complete
VKRIIRKGVKKTPTIKTKNNQRKNINEKSIYELTYTLEDLENDGFGYHPLFWLREE